MPRTEVYQLRLTKAEKDYIASRARAQDISIARFLRNAAGLLPVKGDVDLALRIKPPAAALENE